MTTWPGEYGKLLGQDSRKEWAAMRQKHLQTYRCYKASTTTWNQESKLASLRQKVQEALEFLRERGIDVNVPIGILVHEKEDQQTRCLPTADRTDVLTPPKTHEDWE